MTEANRNRQPPDQTPAELLKTLAHGTLHSSIRLITGPAVWKGSILPSDYWYYLATETIAELDRALRRIRDPATQVSAGAFEG
jgi:hypothetical protein